MKNKAQYRIISLITAALLLITLSGCTAVKSPEKELNNSVGNNPENSDESAVLSIPEENPNERGNTTGNISNGGLASIQGDWIYYSNAKYSNWKNQGYLYKIRTDGTEETQLNEDYCSYINVIGSWVYYRSDDDNGAICKIKTDGTERTVLNASDSKFVTVTGGWIYYLNYSDGSKIYKITTDGTSETKLGDIECGGLAVSDGWLYYSNGSDGWKIYKMSADGIGNVCLTQNSGGSINVTGNYVYFCNAFGTLFRVSTDGLGEVDMCSIYDSYDSLEVKSFSGINITEDTIYYCEELLIDYKLCKVPLDVGPGTAESTLDMDCTGNINVVGDWIYFYGINGANRIHPDGTGKEPIQ